MVIIKIYVCWLNVREHEGCDQRIQQHCFCVFSLCGFNVIGKKVFVLIIAILQHNCTGALQLHSSSTKFPLWTSSTIKSEQLWNRNVTRYHHKFKLVLQEISYNSAIKSSIYVVGRLCAYFLSLVDAFNVLP